MSYEIQGFLYKKFDAETKSGNFTIRDFVVRTESEYPQFVKIQLSNDKCSILDSIAEGWKIKVSFNVKGREWEGKFFNTLAAWKVTVEGRTTSGSSSGYKSEPLVEDAQVVQPFVEDPDNPLPF